MKWHSAQLSIIGAMFTVVGLPSHGRPITMNITELSRHKNKNTMCRDTLQSPCPAARTPPSVIFENSQLHHYRGLPSSSQNWRRPSLHSLGGTPFSPGSHLLANCRARTHSTLLPRRPPLPPHRRANRALPSQAVCTEPSEVTFCTFASTPHFCGFQSSLTAVVVYCSLVYLLGSNKHLFKKTTRICSHSPEPTVLVTSRTAGSVLQMRLLRLAHRC